MTPTVSEIAQAAMFFRAGLPDHEWYPREKIRETAVAIEAVIGPGPHFRGPLIDRLQNAVSFHEQVWRNGR